VSPEKQKAKKAAVKARAKAPVARIAKAAPSPDKRHREHPNDPALSTLLARQEQLEAFLEGALSKARMAHPNDPALSAGLGRLSTLEEKLDRLTAKIDSVVTRQKLPNPNDPALSVVLARIEGIERALERIAGTLAERPASRPAQAAAAPSAGASAGRPQAGGAMSAPKEADTAQFLARTPLFAKLSALECGLLAQHLEPMSLAKGAVLFKQDDFGDAMYVVKAGLLEIYKNDVFGAVRVAEVRPGGLVGEMALVENKPRSANVRASEDSSLLLFSRGAYAQLKEAHPQVATKFQDELLLLLSGRLRQTTDKLVGKN